MARTAIATSGKENEGKMDSLAPVTDPARLRAAFACFPSGVAAICALVNEAPAGLAASSFTSVSLTPPLVSICVRNESETWPLLRGCARLGLSILAEHHGPTCRTLSAKGGDRFAGVDWLANPDGSVLMDGASARMVVSVHNEVEAGDHVLALLRVHGLAADSHIPPLVFHGSRFRRLAATDDSMTGRAGEPNR
ncbi:oxidoreductase [Mycobacterium tuberculosis]|nr:oxidoreductase [Mycobacterium tuberculosis]